LLDCPTLGEDMKRYLKISAIGIFLAILFVVLALLGLWISSLSSLSLMSFDFLNGRAVTACIEHDPRKSPFPVTCASGAPIYHSWIQYYSFEADFNDVCKAADAELLALGFKTHTISVERQKLRVYTLSKATSSKTVIVFDRQRFVGSPRVRLLQPLVADGWVTVKISRGRLPLWPPRYLLYRLKKHLQVAGWQKP
jgi:hypothetical protein